MWASFYAVSHPEDIGVILTVSTFGQHGIRRIHWWLGFSTPPLLLLLVAANWSRMDADIRGTHPCWRNIGPLPLVWVIQHLCGCPQSPQWLLTSQIRLRVDVKTRCIIAVAFAVKQLRNEERRRGVSIAGYVATAVDACCGHVCLVSHSPVNLRILGRPSHSQSLYRLPYPTSRSSATTCLNIIHNSSSSSFCYPVVCASCYMS
jgi:hypothetical protein